MGALNGVILAIFLFASRRNRSVSHVFLGVLLLMLSIRIGKSALLYFDPSVTKIYLQIGLSACFFIGPSLYCYTRATLGSIVTVPKTWLWMFGMLLALVIAGGTAYPYQQFAQIWGQVIIPYVIYLQWSIFLLLSLYRYRIGRSEDRKKPLLKTVLIGNTIILFAYVFSYLNWLPAGTYILGPVMYAFILYLSLFTLFYREGPAREEKVEKYQHKKIAPEQASLMIKTCRDYRKGCPLPQPGS